MKLSESESEVARKVKAALEAIELDTYRFLSIGIGTRAEKSHALAKLAVIPQIQHELDQLQVHCDTKE